MSEVVLVACTKAMFLRRTRRAYGSILMPNSGTNKKKGRFFSKRILRMKYEPLTNLLKCLKN
ncbi:hypothetical protein BpHYR1_004667 [Brachionus plicatilis]|uniref:Uncharacterized protein n=1 Tax=Brachionus plicatilis TaxID=10195 RepID=A0A3M7SJ78_BRAPC|nr:hypothetical protein BpHYR1_004667 [Brachionus plicatilis]